MMNTHIFGSARPAGTLGHRSALMLSSGLLAMICAQPALAAPAANALPTNPDIVGGSASVNSSGSAMTVTQSSDRAVINWGTFDIGASASVDFAQPSTSSIAVNRVSAGGGLSEIHGTLDANGIVVILNPNGIYFDGTAEVNVGGLIATTGDLADQAAFLSGGSLTFQGATSGAVTIASGAEISIADAGLAAFVAPSVANSGRITAVGGTVSLGAAEAFTLDLAGDGLLEIAVPADSSMVANHGEIFARGGRIELTAAAASAVVGDVINMSGTLEVASVHEADGAIVLTAAGDVNLAGTVSGGDVTIAGRRVHGSASAVNTGGELAMRIDPEGADTTTESWIADALNVIGTVAGGSRLTLGAGIYSAGATVTAANVDIDGGGVAKIQVGAGERGLTIAADDIRVSGVEFSGPYAGQDWRTIDWDAEGNSFGVFVNGGVSDFSIVGNTIHNIRTGINVSAGADGSVLGNVIDNTKGGILSRSGDLDILENSQGSYGNEWGIVLGLSNTIAAGDVSSEPSLDRQARILGYSVDNNGLSVIDRAYARSNRTHAFVDASSTATIADDFGLGNGLGNERQALQTIQGGVDAVVSGGYVEVAAGTYVENVLIRKAGLTLQSESGRDATIIRGIAVGPTLGTVQITAPANNVTLGGDGRGFTIIGFDRGNPAVENAAVYIQGANDGTVIRGNRITADGEAGLLSEYSAAVTNLTVDGNIFDGQTFIGANPAGDGFSQQFSLDNVPRQLVVLSGGPGGGNTANIIFTNNQIIGTAGGLNASGAEQGNSLVTIDSKGAVITGNSFAGTTNRYGAQLRARGTDSLIAGNSFDTAGLGNSAAALYVRNSVFGSGQSDFAEMVGANSFTSGIWADVSAGDYHTVTLNLLHAVADAAAGATVNMFDGDYIATGQIVIDKALTLRGESQAGTRIDATAVSGYGMLVDADNVSLSNFTLQRDSSSTSSGEYGVKVQPDTGDASDRLRNFAIENVTIRGSGGSELDLNGVVGATVRNVTLDGQGTKGVGLAITDSADVTVENVTTLDNLWGAIALYQANRFYDQQLDNITVNAAGLSLGEDIGLFLQVSSSLHAEVGQLDLNGFDYALRNADFRSDGDEFLFFETSLQDALDLAVNLDPATANSSVVRGWADGALDSNLYVGFGTLTGGGRQALSIQTAFGASDLGDTITVGTGTYDQTATLTGARNLIFETVTLDGLIVTANGAAVAGQLTTAGDLSFADLSLLGALNLASTGGDLTTGMVIGAHAFAVDAGSGGVTLGALDVASATVSGGTIVTAGATTSGTQSFTGTIVSLNGLYSTGGGAFTVNGVSELTDGTTVQTAGGDVATDAVTGAYAFAVDADTGAVALGALDVASADVSGGAIVTAGATTSGAQSFTGTTVSLNGLYATGGGAFAVSGATELADGTTVQTAGGDVTTDAVIGAHAFTVDAGAGTVTLGILDVASVAISGGTIVTAGATTSGAQSFTGTTVSLNGLYITDGGAFAVNGASTLAGGTTVQTGGGDITADTVDGAYAFTANAGSGDVTLGAIDVASTIVSGATIVTAGATTSGAQSFTGTTVSLNGLYATRGGVFTVNGSAELADATTVETAGGDVATDAVNGAHAFTVDASAGAVMLGALDVASVAVSGGAIATAGATTSGAQSFTGSAVSLDGLYATNGGAFTVNGASALANGTAVETAGGDVTTDSVTGAYALTVDAGTGAVTLGALDIASIAVTGGAILTAGATTSGDQTFAGTTVGLNGLYVTGDGTFTVNGASTLAGGTTVQTGGGDITADTVDGAYAFTVDAGTGAVTLGALDVASANVSGGAIVTAGVTTSGAQTFTGTTVSLAGLYSTGGGAFTVNGASTLAGGTTVQTAGGDATADTVAGAYALSVDAGTGAVTLGALDVASAAVSGGTIVTAGATTSGAQTFTGTTVSLNGLYSTGGGAFTVNGDSMLAGATTVQTGGGDVATDAVDGAHTFAVNAGNGSVVLGSVGVDTGLTSLTVSAGDTVLTGNRYVAGVQSFTGGPVRLTASLTTFDSRQSATAGGDITFAGDLLGTQNGAQDVAFISGTGASADDGDVAIGNAGSDAVRLGSMSVTGGDFSARTVKLAGDFTSLLSGDQVFSASTLDTLGDVRMQVVGAASGPIFAGGSVDIAAGGSMSGAISAGGGVDVQAGGDVTIDVVAGEAVAISTPASIRGTIETPSSITLTSQQNVDVQVDGGAVTVTTPNGVITGVFATIETNGTGVIFINDRPVIDEDNDARRILRDYFIMPVGGVVGPSGTIELPDGLVMALVAPVGETGHQSPAILVNTVDRLGELLRRGYGAIIVEIDESGLIWEEELTIADGGQAVSSREINMTEHDLDL